MSIYERLREERDEKKASERTRKKASAERRQASKTWRKYRSEARARIIFNRSDEGQKIASSWSEMRKEIKNGKKTHMGRKRSK